MGRTRSWIYYQSHRVLICVSLFYLISLSACSLYAPRVQIGDEIPVDLLIYFQTDTTEEEIKLFYEELLDVPHPSGRGVNLLPEVQEVFNIISVENHAAIGLNFNPSTSQTVRDQIRGRIESHPEVYRVLENMAPNQVTTLNK